MKILKSFVAIVFLGANGCAMANDLWSCPIAERNVVDTAATYTGTGKPAGSPQEACYANGTRALTITVYHFALCPSAPPVSATNIDLSQCLPKLPENSRGTKVEIRTDSTRGLDFIELPKQGSFNHLVLLTGNTIEHEASVTLTGGVNGAGENSINPGSRTRTTCVTNGLTLLFNGFASYVKRQASPYIDSDDYWFGAGSQTGATTDGTYFGATCSDQPLSAVPSVNIFSQVGLQNNEAQVQFDGGIVVNYYALRDNLTRSDINPANTIPNSIDETRAAKILFVQTLPQPINVEGSVNIEMSIDFSKTTNLQFVEVGGNYYLPNILFDNGFAFVPKFELTKDAVENQR